ncbi:FAD-dependent oxidoreductase [Aquincola sp. S2]|uniref:FAD-dependent oxidoreductase n=1 Tax=Pseudaquabacterium terrae TaxID=2732868 RepID=A0ABX2EUV6_9BURK|nr:FAD-dependent oxidoreductase [Aquabacterium terrae]NRF72329.1 FAD-dependent oxidoreductase [Aquabacterium terrae]
MKPARTLTEPARSTPVIAETEVLVLGGGPAGIAAAAAAAQAGRRTLLVERYGFLGGMGTAAGVTNFCGLHANVFGHIEQVVHGVVDELLDRMRRMDGLGEPHALFGGKIAAQAYDNAAFKVAADELLLARGAQLLFHALAVGVMMRTPQDIDALLVETKSGRGAITAEVFIDCSGDADLAAAAGVPFEKDELLYPSTMFRIHGVNDQRAGAVWNQLDALMAEAERRGRRFARKTPIVRPQKHAGEWRANVTQLANPDGSAVDGTDAWQLSAAEVEGRRQSVDFMDFLRSAAPGFEHAYLLEIAPQLGIRETRRIVGELQLSDQHVLGCASFADSIGVNGWPIEAHVAGDVHFEFPPGLGTHRGYNQLPLRMIVPRVVDNLLVAGRCASMTHRGQSAARVSGACFVMGEAAGTTAALALQHAHSARELAPAELQRLLQQHGVFLGE